MYWLLNIAVHPPPNWFADGQHILQLGGGTIALSVQLYTAWHTLLNRRAIKDVSAKVTSGDETIVAAVGDVEKAVGQLRGLVADRRKPATAGKAPFTGVDRRSKE